LRLNAKKREARAQQPDRNAQFEQLAALRRKFYEQGGATAR
jgi:hypothetical protein